MIKEFFQNTLFFFVEQKKTLWPSGIFHGIRSYFTKWSWVQKTLYIKEKVRNWITFFFFGQRNWITLRTNTNTRPNENTEREDRTTTAKKSQRDRQETLFFFLCHLDKKRLKTNGPLFPKPHDSWPKFCVKHKL